MRRPAVFAALIMLAGIVAPAAARDATLEALGPGATRLPGGGFLIELSDGYTMTTHGPDPDNHGSGMGPGDPERAPVCATDHYQHVLYGHLDGQTNRLAAVRGTLVSSIKRMNAVLNEEAISSGNRTADYKVLCDAGGAIRIDSFSSPGSSFSTVVDAARAAGFSASNADYSIFFDGTQSGVCGTGSVSRDDRLTEGNWNNYGGDYAVAYAGCWENETMMHENGHNQGAVQASAPNSTGSGAHCYDEIDVMCYSPDGGDRNQGGTIERCTGRLRFDCGNDDYFDADPEPGEYLASHWNIGSPLNRFIALGPLGFGTPSAAFTIACASRTCDLTDRSTDDGSIASWSWDFGDGRSSSISNPRHTFLADGTYLVTLTVTDDAGETASVTQTVTVPNDGRDPDPSTPSLMPGFATTDRNEGQGTWRHFKVMVPPDTRLLTIELDGPDCPAPLFCNPDIDLYVRRGVRPDRNTYACRSNRLSNDETCSITYPGMGYWYVGVYTFFATPRVLIDLSSVQFRVTARV